MNEPPFPIGAKVSVCVDLPLTDPPSGRMVDGEIVEHFPGHRQSLVKVAKNKFRWSEQTVSLSWQRLAPRGE